jgi:hypothetical protein
MLRRAKKVMDTYKNFRLFRCVVSSGQETILRIHGEDHFVLNFLIISLRYSTPYYNRKGGKSRTVLPYTQTPKALYDNDITLSEAF